MLDLVAVGAGGFIGAICRYLIGLIAIQETFVFPVKTFFVNILGCVLIGLITVAVAKYTSCSQQLILFLKVGLCGGFTTFSTFALETTTLLKDGHTMIALLYVLLSVVCGALVIFAMELLLGR